MARSPSTWREALACHWGAWRVPFREAREQQRAWRANKERYEAERTAEDRAGHGAGCQADDKAARQAGVLAEPPGPPPTPIALLPWLLLGMGAFSNLFQGETPNPLLGGLGLLTFNSCYIYVTVRSFVQAKREARSTRAALAIMTMVTCGLAGGYGGNWLLFFPLLGLAAGAALRGTRLREASAVLSVLAGTVAVLHDGWGGLDIAYATWISTVVTAVILTLAEAVRELRAAREELARRAVEKERLRFSRDLHDLLGHTLSVIVVKSEAARRLAPRDLDSALAQITDIESVGRQALTEIREAVTGYREGSLPTELDRARSALTAAGVEPSVSQSGAPVEPQTAALLGWVVREAVTNVVRHSGAAHCGITVSGSTERVRLTVTDDGRGADGAQGADDGRGADGEQGADRAQGASSRRGVDGERRADGGRSADGGRGAARAGVGGTGLTGLRERLAAAGGSLTAGPGPRGGFTVTAELPMGVETSTATGAGAGAGATASEARPSEVTVSARELPPVPAGPTLGP